MLNFLGVAFDPGAIKAVHARPHGPNGHPLGIATRQLARDLLRVHMRLAGELLKDAQGEAPLVRPAKARGLLAAIARLMELLQIDFDPSALPSIRTRIPLSPLGYGGMRSGIVRALKDTGTPMTYDELAQTVLARGRAQLSIDRYRRFRQKIREACHALKKRGLIEPKLSVGLSDGLTRQRWRIRRRPIRVSAYG